MSDASANSGQRLPTGTVTFLFTDIEGSTRLAQQHAQAWESMRRRHDEILRSAAAAQNGYVFKSIGDAFCMAFHSPSQGLRAALEAQHGLQGDGTEGARVKVRMGIHTGEAELLENGDYIGYLALSRTQRLMSAGHGGQVLVSLATQELVRDELPEGVTLRDMGERRLRDLIRPEHIYQVVAPDLMADFPPLKTLDAYRHNLPAQTTSFIGREKEIAELKQAIGHQRLITLTGSGGTGKTRLSLQVAADLLDAYPDGVWFLELAQITDPELVPNTLAAVLGLRESAETSQSVTELICGYLRPRKALLIFDNCEHLIEACALLADLLLRSCKDIRVLATSREALGVGGEMTWQVPSLSLPDIEHLPDIEQLIQYETVRLLIDRTSLVQPHFAVTADNAWAIAQICYHLDGIPLAIELAAARLRMLSPDQMASHLDDRFRLLTGSSRTSLPHHQTLRGMIDWSFNLLTQEERTVLRYLSVFLGGWTLDGAEAVCGIPDVLELLTRLVDKSMVIADRDRDKEARYHLLETIRQYVCEKLRQAGEEIETRNRHLLFFLAFSEMAEIKLQGTDLTLWLDRLEVEQRNLRAALEWATDSDPILALRIVAALWFFWSRRASVSEGLRWAKLSLTRAEVLLRAQAQPEPETLLIWSRALAAEAALAYDSGDLKTSQVAAENSTSLSRKINDSRTLALSLGIGAKANALLGNIHEARACAEEAIEICCKSRYKFELGLSLSALIMSADFQYLEESGELRKEATRVLREGANPWMLALNIFDSAVVAEMQGDLARAIASFEEAAQLFDEMRDLQYFTACRSMQAHMHRRHNQLQNALMLYRQAIRSWRDLGHLAAVAHELECFAFIAIEQGQVERAVTLLGAAEVLREKSNSRMTSEERGEYDRSVTALRTGMDENTFALRWAAGRAMLMEKAIELALEE